MKGLAFHGVGDIRYQTLPDPQLHGAGDALIRITSCSICGSDLHIFHGKLGLPKQCFSVGHEAIGEVVETGSEVRRLKTGDKVMIPGSVGCGTCRYCAAGIVNKCETQPMRVYGIGRGLDGCQAEAVAVPAADFNAMPIPDGVTDDQALMLTDSLPTAYTGCINAGIAPGSSVAIIGLGPIGLNAVEIAFVLGAGKVFAIDPVPERREFAAGLGAVALHPDDAMETVKEATGGRLLDCAVEVVGAAATIDLAIALVGQHGTVSVIGAGVPGYEFPILAAFMKGLTFRVSICSVQRYLPELIKLVQGGRLRPERTISHR
jgi:2-desacetyl-2-hydroxyethyl bacteriochlorophyllide A dehydrogenase